MYAVDELSDYQIGPLGGPMYQDWTFDPKPRADPLTRAKAVESLQSKWTQIAGAKLAAVTWPLRLTGSKGRRLLVLVRTQRPPPWGSWTTLAKDERRRSFTAFRKAVNSAIAPLEVDHIDFITSSDPPGV